jgi:hypothetical protein
MSSFASAAAHAADASTAHADGSDSGEDSDDGSSGGTVAVVVESLAHLMLATLKGASMGDLWAVLTADEADALRAVERWRRTVALLRRATEDDTCAALIDPVDERPPWMTQQEPGTLAVGLGRQLGAGVAFDAGFAAVGGLDAIFAAITAACPMVGS